MILYFFYDLYSCKLYKDKHLSKILVYYYTHITKKVMLCEIKFSSSQPDFISQMCGDMLQLVMTYRDLRLLHYADGYSYLQCNYTILQSMLD